MPENFKTAGIAFAQSKLELIKVWLLKQVAVTKLCRGCDYKVGFNETVCPRCGASDPARVPWKAVAALFSIVAIVIVLSMWLFT